MEIGAPCGGPSIDFVENRSAGFDVFDIFGPQHHYDERQKSSQKKKKELRFLLHFYGPRPHPLPPCSAGIFRNIAYGTRTGDDADVVRWRAPE
jgi:hypothetical protein